MVNCSNFQIGAYLSKALSHFIQVTQLRFYLLFSGIENNISLIISIFGSVFDIFYKPALNVRFYLNSLKHQVKLNQLMMAWAQTVRLYNLYNR
jgi:hypothetical protein